MDWKEIISSIAVLLIGISSVVMVIMCVYDIIKSHKYYKDMQAHLDLMRVTFKKEHDLLKKVQAYGEWLDTYHTLMHTNVKLEDSEFNNGTLTAAGDCLGEFLNTMGEYVDESRNNEQDK